MSRARRASASVGKGGGAQQRFGPDYYDRYYYDRRTAVVSRAEMRERARLIAAYTRHVGLPLRRILDAGCGIGLLRAPLRRAFPRARYVALEASEYLCHRYGWTHGALERWQASEPFDLVVCYDVLQYLDDRAAAQALANLGRLTRGVLYFSALTLRDWRANCDRKRTDRDVQLRTGAWYRQRLSRSFRAAGAGFWMRRGAPLVAWDLEMAEERPGES